MYGCVKYELHIANKFWKTHCLPFSKTLTIKLKYNRSSSTALILCDSTRRVCRKARSLLTFTRMFSEDRS